PKRCSAGHDRHIGRDSLSPAAKTPENPCPRDSSFHPIRRTGQGMLNFASFRPVFSLLRGTAFLLAASGLHGLLLPLRGQLEGFSTASLGLLGTAWAGGFVTGCYFAPRIVRRAGHVRAFGAFAASGAIIALLTGLLID